MASKLVYNMKGDVSSASLAHLDFITTYAQQAARDFQSHEDVKPFGQLELLCRDWQHYEDEWLIEDCHNQMLVHKAEHFDPNQIANDAVDRVTRLHDTFKDISVSGLCHPGLDATRPTYSGEI